MGVPASTNIVVCVKNVVDETELRADSRGGPQLEGAQTRMGTFDRNAVEEAVRKKESDQGSTVTVLALGDADAKKSIKEALAMGCDRGVHILSEGDLDSLGTAYCLAKAIARLDPDLVLCSEGASDTYQGQVGPMLAEFLGLPFFAYARKTSLDATKRLVSCEQSFDEGVRVCEGPLPAVVSVVSEANEPRYPTLLQIMQSGKKPVEEIQVSSLKDAGFPETGLEVLETKLQTSPRKRVMFEGSAEETSRKLLGALKQEGLV